jgi:hypothetical protein
MSRSDRFPGLSDQERREILERLTVRDGVISDVPFGETRPTDSKDPGLCDFRTRLSNLPNLDDGFEKLSSEEQRLITLRFGIADGRFRSVEQIAEEFGGEPVEIEKIIDHALWKLRHPEEQQAP